MKTYQRTTNMKIKIYFWKHGFQTTGESLWVVQHGKGKWFAKVVETDLLLRTKFSKTNPHAYFQCVGERYMIDGTKEVYEPILTFEGWVCNKSTQTCHYKKISIL